MTVAARAADACVLSAMSTMVGRYRITSPCSGRLTDSLDRRDGLLDAQG